MADAREVRGAVDIVTLFNSLHDTSDPLGAAQAAGRALAPDGCVLAVEPAGQDRLEDNMTPLGRMVYGISTLVCVPCSVSDGGPGLAPGPARAGPARSSRRRGFATFRRVAQTPLNVVYEGRCRGGS